MYLVFDIGGTNMRVAVSADGKTIKESKLVLTPQDFEQGIQVLKQIAGKISNGEKIEGVAGGIAGPMDKDFTMIINSPHLPGWINKPLKLRLEKEFKCKVLIYNDTVLEGIGEAVKGAGAGKKVVAYLTIGTGVGGKRIVNQKIDENSLRFEPGHQIIVPDGNLCNCGGRGCLETYVAGYYIEKTYHQKAEDIKDAGIWNEIAKYLSIGLNNTIVHWTPDIIVLGGSIMKSLPIGMVTNHLKDKLAIYSETPQLVLASLGQDAGLHGALELLKY